MSRRTQAAEAYVKALRTGESSATEQAGQYLADDVVLATGGTGVAPRDVTPEALRAVAHREIPGFGELMRSEGRKSTKFASLSRGGAVTRGTTLLVSLPGSPRGAVESLNAVSDLIEHVVDLLHGRTEHKEKLGASS